VVVVVKIVDFAIMPKNEEGGVKDVYMV